MIQKGYKIRLKNVENTISDLTQDIYSVALLAFMCEFKAVIILKVSVC